MFAVAGGVVTSKAFLAAACGEVDELQPLRVAGKDLPLVVQLHLLRVLDAWQHHEAGLGCAIAPERGVRVWEELDCAHCLSAGEGCHKQILIWLTVAAEKQ